MFAVMTTETTRGIDVTQVIGVCRPINFLIVEDSAVIDGLDLSYCLLDFFTVLAVVISKISSCNLLQEQQ